MLAALNIRRLKKDLQKSQDLNSTLKTELSKMKHDLEYRDRKIYDLELNSKMLSSNLASKNGTNSLEKNNLSEQLDSKQKTIQSLEVLNDKLKNDISSLTKSNQLKEKEAVILEKEIFRVRKKMQLAQDEISQLENEKLRLVGDTE